MTAFAVHLGFRAHPQTVTEEVGAFTESGDVISDASAVAIAGYFSEPLQPNHPFNLLAERGRADTAELGAAIKAELERAEADPDNDPDELLGLRGGALMLDALDAWAAAHEVP